MTSGTSGIFNELITDDGAALLLATRFVTLYSSRLGYRVSYGLISFNGSLRGETMCEAGSWGNNAIDNFGKMRVVVSLPPDRVKVKANGTVKLIN